ncbi:MAG: 50S ribosomal protein L18 [Candidatus Bathyarchaeia archaeon]
MAHGPTYRVPFRRRREGKTDYRARRALVLSGLPRVVIRGSLKHVTVQFVEAKVGGDEVVAAAHSSELRKTYGWNLSCGNLPSAYLTGLLAGLRAVAKGVKDAVLDIGLHSPTKGARVFAAFKGVLDAGVKVPHSKEKMPDDKRIKGQHIVDYAKKLSSNPEEYQRRFSKCIEKGATPEKVSEEFLRVKEEILSSIKKGAKKN